MRHRPAFTLVETLVALALFQFGMLALAAGVAVAARDLAAARRATTAHTMARNRVEWLASASCPTSAMGTAQTDGYIEYWRVEAAGEGRLIGDSVAFPKPDGTRGFVVMRAAKWCRP